MEELNFDIEINENGTLIKLDGKILFNAFDNNVLGAGTAEKVTQSFVNSKYKDVKREKIYRQRSANPAALADLEAFLDSEVATLKGVLVAKHAVKEGAIKYEKAVATKVALELEINGRDEVIGQDEVIDSETLEVTQEFIQALDAKPALDVEIDTTDEDGNRVTITNPALIEAQAALAVAQGVIDGAAQEVLNLAGLRAGV